MRITKGSKVLKRADRSQINEAKANRNEGKKNERNFQIGIGDHRIAVLLQVESLRVVETQIVAHGFMPSRDAGGRPAGSSAEDVVGESGDFQEGVDGRQERNEEDGKEFEELCRRDCSVRLEIHRAENEIGDDEYNGCGDDLVEGILDERLEPSPEDPFEFRNDEERYEDRAD